MVRLIILSFGEMFLMNLKTQTDQIVCALIKWNLYSFCRNLTFHIDKCQFQAVWYPWFILKLTSAITVLISSFTTIYYQLTIKNEWVEYIQRKGSPVMAISLYLQQVYIDNIYSFTLLPIFLFSLFFFHLANSSKMYSSAFVLSCSIDVIWTLSNIMPHAAYTQGWIYECDQPMRGDVTL